MIVEKLYAMKYVVIDYFQANIMAFRIFLTLNILLQVVMLLIQLTKSNANIQKIVAFENAFDRLFDVIQQEGNSDGGIVVQDCLSLMLNLLRGNVSNQNFFKEGNVCNHISDKLYSILSLQYIRLIKLSAT